MVGRELCAAFALPGGRNVRLEREAGWWLVSDDDGEFARASSLQYALRYVDDLIYGVSRRVAV